MVKALEFVNAEVLEIGVSGPDDANRLFIATGVVIINFMGINNDFLRDSVTFNIPKEGATNPADPASDLLVTNFRDSVVSVFPASAQSTSGTIIGWAVDEADTVSNGTRVTLTAQLAVRGPGTTLFRIGYHVSILARVP